MDRPREGPLAPPAGRKRPPGRSRWQAPLPASSAAGSRLAPPLRSEQEEIVRSRRHSGRSVMPTPLVAETTAAVRPALRRRSSWRRGLIFAAGLWQRAVAKAGFAPAAPFDVWLVGALLVLLCFGLVVVYSSSAVYAERSLGRAAHFLRAQASWTLLGAISMGLAACVPSRWLREQAAALYAGTLLLLGVVLVPHIGHFVGGARRWLVLGPLSCQPSEAAKLSMVIVLATLFAKGGGARAGRRGLLVPVLLCQLPVALIVVEPDLGGAIVIELILATLLFASGLRARVLGMLALAALPMLYHLVVGTPFRLRRVLGYIDPWAFRSTIGYQVTEALISIGSGGLWGVGLGDGKQKLFFLPEAHTDFIFAILAEELGLVGVSVLLLAFATFVVRGARLACLATLPFDRYLALGLTALVGIPAVLNLSVATGLLPTKGLPLPFISYGGSNLLVTLTGVGFLLRIDHEQRSLRAAAAATGAPLLGGQP